MRRCGESGIVFVHLGDWVWLPLPGQTRKFLNKLEQVMCVCDKSRTAIKNSRENLIDNEDGPQLFIRPLLAYNVNAFFGHELITRYYNCTSLGKYASKYA